MDGIEKKLVPFVLGFAVGHWGLRWFMHVGYLAAVVAAFFMGKHFT